MPKKPSPKGETRSMRVVLRIEPNLVERVDAHAERLQEEKPGMRYSRSDAIRVLLNEALAKHEPERTE